jgi:hypothetical protein
MDLDATLARKRAPIVLVAVVAALGCGGGSLPGSGPGGAGGGGAGGGGGSPLPCCYKDAVPFTSVVHGRGFAAYEGRTVKAVFRYATSQLPETLTTLETSVSGGAFDFAFVADPPTCLVAGGTIGFIYIDADGDGVCSPSADYIYAWSGDGPGGSACGTIDLDPQSPSCTRPGGVDANILEFAQMACPATNGCLSCDGGKSFSCLI